MLVEDCYFQGKTGDNDDVDLYGESTPTCIVRHNLFDIPSEDDRIHPTLCSVIIDGIVIRGSTDHGIVLRDRSSPIVTNNIISNCLNGGIAVENSCTALIVNNTIVNCSKGIRLLDLGRWDPPYHLNPGGGIAAVINCIIWDCPQSMTLADTPNTQVEDRGSHVTVKYCDIKGGHASISVSGANSTVIWDQCNININPQFANPGKKDFHLKSQVGRWDPTSQSWVRDGVTSPCIDAGDPNDANWRNESWPHGGRINMGAYGRTPQASMSTNRVGCVADLDGNLMVDMHDFAEFALYWRIRRWRGTSDRPWPAGNVSLEPPWAADLDRDGNVDFRDLAVLGEQWLTGAGQP